jgi:hypothetical protein
MAWSVRSGKRRRLSTSTRTLSLHLPRLLDNVIRPALAGAPPGSPIAHFNGGARLRSAATIQPLFTLPSVAENRYHWRSAFQKSQGREPR